jgi:hypothetical protein
VAKYKRVVFLTAQLSAFEVRNASMANQDGKITLADAPIPVLRDGHAVIVAAQEA